MEKETELLISEEADENIRNKDGEIDLLGPTKRYGYHTPIPWKNSRKFSRFFAFFNMTFSVFFHLLIFSLVLVDILLIINVIKWIIRERGGDELESFSILLTDLIALMCFFFLITISYIPLILSTVSNFTIISSTDNNKKEKFVTRMSRISLLLSSLSAIIYFVIDCIELILIVVLLVANILWASKRDSHVFEYIKLLGLTAVLMTIAFISQVICVIPQAVHQILIIYFPRS